MSDPMHHIEQSYLLGSQVHYTPSFSIPMFICHLLDSMLRAIVYVSPPLVKEGWWLNSLLQSLLTLVPPSLTKQRLVQIYEHKNKSPSLQINISEHIIIRHRGSCPPLFCVVLKYVCLCNIWQAGSFFLQQLHCMNVTKQHGHRLWTCTISLMQNSCRII